MKYILILLISFAFSQVPFVPIGMGETEIDTFAQEIKADDDLVRALNLLYDPDFYKPECYKAVLEFSDGWEIYSMLILYVKI